MNQLARSQSTKELTLSCFLQNIFNEEEYIHVIRQLNKPSIAIKTIEELVELSERDYEGTLFTNEEKKRLNDEITKMQLRKISTQTKNKYEYIKSYQSSYTMDYHFWSQQFFQQYLLIHQIPRNQTEEIIKQTDSQSFVTSKTIQSQFSECERLQNEMKKEYASTVLVRALRSINKQQQNEKLEQRREVIKEIVSTENSYVTQLQIVIDYVLKPLETSKLLSSDEKEKIFGDIEKIYFVNNQFRILLNSFKEEKYDNLLIGKMFNDMSNYFNIYGSYNVNYLNASTIIQEMKRSKHPFIEWTKTQLKQCEIEEYRELSISSFLITPIQRLPRYILLMKEIVKYTPTSHPDFPFANEAIEKANEITTKVNEQITAAEMQQKIEEIQSNIIDLPDIYQFSTKNKQFIYEGKANLWIKKKMKKVQLYLFDDMFLICKILDNSLFSQKKQAFKYYQHHFIRQIKFLDLISKDCEGKENCTQNNSFSIEGKKGEKCIYSFVSDEDKNQWMEKLTDQIKKKEEESNEIKTRRSVDTLMKANFAKDRLDQIQQSMNIRTGNRKWNERGKSILQMDDKEKCCICKDLVEKFSSQISESNY